MGTSGQAPAVPGTVAVPSGHSPPCGQGCIRGTAAFPPGGPAPGLSGNSALDPSPVTWLARRLGSGRMVRAGSSCTFPE